MDSALHRLWVFWLGFCCVLAFAGPVAADQYVTFHGIVSDEKGNPIPHARIYFGEPGRKALVRTDSKGQFTGEKFLFGGTIVIAALADGYSPAAITCGPQYGTSPDPANLKFVLTPSATRDGVVQNAAGKPVAGIKITPNYNIENITYYGRTVISDAMGRFQIRELPGLPKKPKTFLELRRPQVIKVTLSVTGPDIVPMRDVEVPPEGMLEIKVQKPQPLVALAK